jgi:hypothetical protein
MAASKDVSLLTASGLISSMNCTAAPLSGRLMINSRISAYRKRF